MHDLIRWQRPPLRVLVAGLVVSIVVLAWTWPITRKMIADGDFPTHLALARSIVDHPSLPAPHFLFFGLVAAVIVVLPGIATQAAGLLAVSALHIGTALLVVWYLWRAWGRLSLATVAVAAGLLIVGPILPWSLEPDQYLVGYFAPNPYHNATFTTAKPFCLWLLLVAAAAFGSHRRARLVVAALVAVGLTAISKPNYLTCLVPAVAAYALWRWMRRRPVDWMVVAAITVPATGAVLLMQRLYGDSNMSVVFAPFAALSYFVPVGAALGWQLLGAIAFPAAVVVLWPSLLGRADLWLAWGAAVLAFAEGYLLGEAGLRMNHGNLLVAASQGVFVLMVASAAALGSLPRARRAVFGVEQAKRALAWTLFAWHLIGGARHVGAKLNLREWNHPLTYVALAFVIAWTATLLMPRARVAVATSPQTPA